MYENLNIEMAKNRCNILQLSEKQELNTRH